jgi:hypothetical protein
MIIIEHVQRMLGHKDAAMTLKVYASLFEDDLGRRLRPLGRSTAGSYCGLRASWWWLGVRSSTKDA